MSLWVRILLVAAAGAACVLAWGYWYSLTHAWLHLRVDDYALKTQNQLYGAPHGVSLILRDASNAQLAVARSVEPLGYILAVHPSSEIGNCEQHGRSQSDYSVCFKQYSSWLSSWASRVRSADVSVGTCELHDVAVATSRSNSEWPLWWVPLRHIGGLPLQYFEFRIAVDSRTCVAVVSLPGG